MNLKYERLVVMAAALLLSLIIAYVILRKQKSAGLPLACSTLALTAALLGFYHYSVRDPSHGMGILILPIATLWLWWRRELTGKPDIAPRTFILLQLLLCGIYLLVVWFQEH
jgi:hypothetical protein